MRFGVGVARRAAVRVHSTVVLAAALAGAAAWGAPDPAAQLFSQRCSSCHSVGQGNKVGPDLLGVTQRRDKAWVTKFVRAPAAAIDDKDPIAVELFSRFNGVKMPDQELSDAELDALWGYFASCTTQGGCLPAALGPKWGLDATAEEIAHGEALFAGSRALQNRGPACFSCHTARGLEGFGGGTLGSDLTFSYATLGEERLTTALESTASPVMKNVYGDKPLTADEQYALKAYFAALAKDGELPRRDRDFFLLGLEGAGLLLGLFAIVWGRRG
jgi:mono/diheme cytochrome c family protein